MTASSSPPSSSPPSSSTTSSSQVAANEFARGLAGIVEQPPRKPLIAAVEGYALAGGCEIALACDLIVAGASAKFVMAYNKVGLTPDGGASWFLSQALPRQLATEILIEGKPVSSARLHEAGLVNRVVPDQQALSAALAWSDELAALSPHAIGNIKSLLREAPTNSLSQHFEAEKQSFVSSLHHRDGLEGISAFLEKRKPIYR